MFVGTAFFFFSFTLESQRHSQISQSIITLGLLLATQHVKIGKEVELQS
jgi:hypothetical protein